MCWGVCSPEGVCPEVCAGGVLGYVLRVCARGCAGVCARVCARVFAGVCARGVCLDVCSRFAGAQLVPPCDLCGAGVPPFDLLGPAGGSP